MNYTEMILGMAAGLGLFLYGMELMSKGMEKVAGSKMKSVLEMCTKNRFVGVIVGILFTAVIQSSSVTTSMVVSFVNSGLMSFANTLGVIFGANIGTTITAWLLSLSGLESDSFIIQLVKPQNFTPILAIIGIAFTMMSKSEKKKTLGTIFVGFTVLIYGMDIMSDAVSGLADSPKFAALLTSFNNPVISILIGALVTAVIQSSSASVGILQALSLTGSITYNMAIPIIMGQNIGTCVTGLISCIGASANAKRVALSHTLVNVMGTVILLPVYLVSAKVLNFTLANEAVSPASIAVIHTIFNFATVALLLPFTKLIAKLAQKLIKEKAADENAPKRATYLDERLFNSPAVAIMECDNYTTKMALLAKETVEKAMKLLTDYDEEIAKEIVECEDTLDMYEDELGTYLVKLSTFSLTAEDSHKISRMLHSIGDFERLGDHALNLKKTAQEIHEKKVVFSEEAVKEINVLISAISEIIIMTTNVYEKNDVKGANKIEPLEQVIDKLTAKIKSNHISRLQQGDCTIEMGFVLSDLITNCERISDHCSNIGVAVIEGQSDSFDPHQYLNSIKTENEEFKALYSEYKEKYAI